MSCQHHHPHGHHHDHGSGRIKILLIVLVLTTIYLFAEVIGGWLTGSLALLADAGHMLADVGAIGLALFAAWFSQYPPPPQKTYGYHRLEILAALVNGMVLVGISVWILIEAAGRWSHPPDVKAQGMLIISIGGLIVNLVAAWLLHGAQGENLNLKGAYLHVLGDLLGSVGAVTASILILTQGFYWADPLFSMVISVLILASAVKLVIEALNILLESSPAHINVGQVREEMLGLCGVLSVHDLHVWTIASGKDALSAHVVVEKEAYTPETLTCIQGCLKEKFGLSHLTLQLEPLNFEEDEIHF